MTIVLPLLHADWDTPVVLVPIADIMAGDSTDSIDFTATEGCYSPQRKRDGYGVLGWRDWLDRLSTEGIRNPITWDPYTRRLGEGHHRVIAALDLGWTHVPVVLANDPQRRCIGSTPSLLDAYAISNGRRKAVIPGHLCDEQCPYYGLPASAH